MALPASQGELSLTAEQVSAVEAAATRIRLRMSRTAGDIIEIGRDLIRVKDLVGHGNFLPWIDGEFGMGQATAYKFMQAAENIGDKFTPDVSLTASVVYALAAPGTPDEVRDEILDRAKSGAKVTSQEVLDLKRQVKEAKAKASDERSTRQAVEARSLGIMAERDEAARENLMLKTQVKNLHEQAQSVSAEPHPAPPPSVIVPAYSPNSKAMEAWSAMTSAERAAFVQWAVAELSS